MELLPSLMAVKGVPSSSCKRITFRATSFPFTLETKAEVDKRKKKYGNLAFFFFYVDMRKKEEESIKISEAGGEQRGLLSQ